MKTTAFALIAAAAVAFAGPALASDDIKVDSQIVEINYSAGFIKLANGITLDQSIEKFAMPANAVAGDAVRVTFDDTQVLEGVTVLR